MEQTTHEARRIQGMPKTTITITTAHSGLSATAIMGRKETSAKRKAERERDVATAKAMAYRSHRIIAF